MGLHGAEQVILFDFILIILLTTYGVTATGVNMESINKLPTPTLSPLPDSTKCASWDWVCVAIGNNPIAQATAYIGWAIVNFPAFLGYLLTTTVTYLVVTEAVVFSPQFSPNGVPYVGYFYNALQFVVVLEVIRIFRGSSSGF